MPMQSSWVDEIFKRLSVRYGAAFTRIYSQSGVEPEEVRADWANVLDGLTAGHVSYGLDRLDPDRPPNAAQFRGLCRRYSEGVFPALPAPSQEGMRRMAQELAPLKLSGITFHELLAYHQRRRDGGEKLSPAQRSWLAAAERKAGIVREAA